MTARTIPAASYDESGPVGAMARTFLRASPVRRLTVEVDWVEGREPSDAALTGLRDVLRTVCDKPGGITIVKGAVPGGGGRSPIPRSSQYVKDTYTIGDLQTLRSAYRDLASADDVATIWIVFVNGSLSGSPDALGVAYSASDAAIFRDRIDAATTAVLLAAEIERSVITHEAGHILALVNIGYRSRIAHEDAQHPHHSNNPESVMYWAVEDVSIRNLLGGGPPSDFDDADRADLETLKRS